MVLKRKFNFQYWVTIYLDDTIQWTWGCRPKWRWWNLWKRWQVQELPPQGEPTHVQKSSSCRLFIGLAKEMCSSVFSTWRNPNIGALLCHSTCSRKPLGLLLAMVCCIQQGLWALTKAFCRPPAINRGKGQVLPRDRPCPRVETLYIFNGMVNIALSRHHSTKRRATGRRTFCASSPVREITIGSELYS